MEVLVYDDKHEFHFNARPKAIHYIVSNDQWKCWNCVSHTKDKDGYVKISRNGKTVRLHRWVYETEKGKIPEGYVVQHLCDNPSCFKPEHLVVSTAFENNQQAYYKHRKVHIRDKSGKFSTGVE